METEILKETESCLRYFPEANSVLIKALSGERIIADATDVFRKHISGSLLIRGLINPGSPTPETWITGRDICGDANFTKIFGDFERPLEDLCLTQDQICEFSSNDNNLLSPNDASFFLFRRNEKKPAAGDNLFVACVTKSSGGLMVREERYQDVFIWYGNRGLRVFVPKAA